MTKTYQPVTSKHVDTGGGTYIEGGVLLEKGDFVDTKIVINGAPLRNFTPPQEPTALPALVDFVGRATEQRRYRSELADTGLAMIAGLTGVGKTMLAVALAGQLATSRKVFWHSFREGEGLDFLLLQFAGFLACHQRPSVWDEIQIAQLVGGRADPPDALFKRIVKDLKGLKALICLDNFQFVDEDPLLAAVIEQMAPLRQVGDLALIITSWRRPRFIAPEGFQPLLGLSVEDVAALLEKRKVHIDSDLIKELRARTEGNAQFIVLAIDGLRPPKNPARQIAQLIEAENIEAYLLDRLDRNLSPEQRDILCALAILNYPSTRSAIEFVLGDRKILRPLDGLNRRFLVNVNLGESKRAYHVHTLIQNFYLEQTEADQRNAMRRRAAAFYEESEVDILRALQYYAEAQLFSNAAELAIEHDQELINQGKISSLANVLTRLAGSQLSPELRAGLNIALGRIHHRIGGKPQLALEHCQAALTILKTCPDSLVVRKLFGRAYRLRSALAAKDSLPEALDWLTQGLASVGTEGNTDEKAWLHLRIGEHLTTLGKYADAQEALETALSPEPQQPTHLHIELLINLGRLHGIQGHAEKFKTLMLSAYEMSKELQSYTNMLVILVNLGISQHQTGEWAQAVQSYEEALTLAQQLGSTNQQKIPLLINLGWIYKDRGDDQAAFQYLSQTLDLVHGDYKDRAVELYALCNLVDLHLRRGEGDQAVVHLKVAETLAEALQLRPLQPFIHTFWALTHLAQGRLYQATRHSNRALALAREQQMAQVEGVCLRVRGQVLAAKGAHQSGLKAFQQSLKLLVADPYESARTKLQMGLALLQDDSAHAAVLLDEAQRTFYLLGARRELALLEKLRN